MFVIIMVVLIFGVVVDWLKFGVWLLFVGLWVMFVYFLVVYWVFVFDGFVVEYGGWIVNKLYVIDFVGGIVVYINVGVVVLMLVIVLGKRCGWLVMLF